MKSSMILGLAIIGIVCTSIISFASDIKILSENKVDYIPVKNIIQKLGGKVDISGNNAKIIIDGKSIVIDKNLSFAKVDDEYYPLNTKKINSIEVPVDTEPIFEKDEVYIEKDFFKNYKIINYTIKEGNIKVILDKEKSIEQNLEKDRNKKKEKNEVKEALNIDKKNDDSKQLNEASESKSVTKVQRPSRQTNLEKIQVQSKPDINSSSNTNNKLENDKKDIVKTTEDMKPEDTKEENQQTDTSKPEASNDQQIQGQGEEKIN